MFRLLPTLLLLLLSLPLRGADAPPRELSDFLDAHCTECHDDSVKKGGLNLLDLNFSPDDPANFATWRRVHERVHDGEMPPKKEKAPPAAETSAFLAGLKAPLVDADESRIASIGRVQSRRLTAREYENTIHDLLGIDIPLANLLPEDPETHGFETVASGQQLSYHQLGRYLETADLALDEAFSRALNSDATYRRELTPAELVKNRAGNYRGPDLRDGRSITWPIGLQFFGRMRPTAVPESGWYRVTLKEVKGINPGKDGAVWGTLRSGKCESDAPTLFLMGLVEATATPRDLVFEGWIEKGHQLELRPNDGTYKLAPTGAKGGNVSFQGRNLAKEGYPGISHRGIIMQRIYPNGDRAEVRRALFGDEGLEHWEKPSEALRPLVLRFARRAFRRPVSEEQLTPHLALATEALEHGSPLSEALRAAYRSVLCSPRFLTFVEKPGPLDDHAIAARLSYALWCGPPDWKLIKLAAEGKLREPATLVAEVERMLGDPRAERFVRSFTGQWLKLKQIDFTTPDPKRFRGFDSVLQESFVQETRAYFADLVRQDLGVEHLVDSDFAYLNGRLARHYQIDVPLEAGGGLQRVALPEPARATRGGFVTQGAILKVTADGSHTSPVIRGVFINERILGVHIPAPPPGVPAIEPDIRGAVSIRDQLAKHRSSESCVSCHLTIDPPGFALENFDPVGVWRTKYGEKGAKIDPSGNIPGGGTFDGIGTWKAHYRDCDADLARGFARQFLTYATGAVPHFSDAERIDGIVAAAAEKNHGLRSLITAAVTSDIFLTK